MFHPKVIAWDEARKRTHDRGYSMPFVSADCGAKQIGLHISVVDPGEAAHEPHEHEGEEIMYLMEGTAEATIGGEKHVMQAESALFCPTGVMHGLSNCGDRPVKYMVIRAL